jgi:integrase
MEVKAPNVKTDRRHSRRCPTDDELRQLWLYLDKPVCPDRRKLSARCRAIGYRVCMGTGFRAGELMRLSRQHFDLDRAIVMLPAKDDKRGKPVLQPLPAWLVTELREWFGGGGGCWQKITSKSRSLLKEDLIAAGVPYAVNGPDGPEFFDMHALRVRYITDLCMDPKNDIKTIMHLARHSDARLTLEIYAKCRPDAVRATVDRLPRPGGE